MREMADDFRHDLRKVCCVAPTDTVLVALSGGADSVALLRLLIDEGQPVAAVHCNFHLRGEESDRDEQFCRALCDRLGVALHVEHFDTAAEAQQSGESIEMAARRLRYALFDRLCAAHHYAAVAVAHHRDDNVETILLNIVRGTGLDGLMGMRFHRGNVVRPLLSTTHEQLLNYLQQIGQDYVVDSTNADTHYRRNFIRHRVLPLLRELNPSFDDALFRLSDHVLDAQEVLLDVTSNEHQHAFTTLPHGVDIDLTELHYHASFRIFHDLYGFTDDAVEHLFEWQSLSERAVLESKEYTAVVRGTTLELTRRPTPFAPLILPSNGVVSLPDDGCLRITAMERSELDNLLGSANRAVLDADKVRGALVYRAATRADRFVPFGMHTAKSIHSFLKAHHVSAPRREWVRVIADDDGILWLVGHRPDRRAAVTAETRRVLLIEHAYAPKFPEI